MTEIKERIEELNKALTQETDNLQKLEAITNETKNKIISIRGGIAELSRIQRVFDQNEFDEAQSENEEGDDDEEE